MPVGIGIEATIELVFDDALHALESRVAEYAGAHWSAIWDGMGEEVRQHEVAGETMERPLRVRRILDDGADHCRTCPGKAGEYDSWETMQSLCGGVPGDGSDACHSNCRCRLQFERDGEWQSFFEEPTSEPPAPSIDRSTPEQAWDYGDPKELSPEAGARWGEKRYGDIDLTPDQLSALRSYQEHEFAYINQELRGGIPDRLRKFIPKGNSPAELRAKMARIDEVLQQRPLDSTQRVFRGVGGDAFGKEDLKDLRKAIKPGDAMVDQGYLSTAFGREHQWGGFSLEIIVPKGTPATYVSAITKTGQIENELLLGRGGTLRILSVNERGAVAEFIPPLHTPPLPPIVG